MLVNIDMRTLVVFALFSIAAAKPGGLVSGWGDPHGIPSYSVVQQPVAVHQPVVTQQYVSQPVVTQQYAPQPVVTQQYAPQHVEYAPQHVVTQQYEPQQVLTQQYVAQPVVHAAHAVAIAKPAATSYSSFQRVIHPVAQQVVHAPVVSQPVFQVSQPVVHAAPVIQQPIVHSYAQPVVSKSFSVGSYGDSYGHGW